MAAFGFPSGALARILTGFPDQSFCCRRRQYDVAASRSEPEQGSIGARFTATDVALMAVGRGSAADPNLTLPLPPGRSLCRIYAGARELTSQFYALGLSSCSSTKSGARVMLDLVYLALGIGLFALMGLYARWAANA